MTGLLQEIAKVLYRISNDIVESYYGISPDPLAVENALLTQRQHIDASVWTPDGWDIRSDVFLDGKELTQLPTCANLEGSLYCGYNNLISLKGSPSIIWGNFSCDSNKLTSLEHGPSMVKGYFNCANNQIISLKGVPYYIRGSFDCSNNKLASLEHSPSKIGVYFNCSDNQLTSLDHGPTAVRAYYNYNNNPIGDPQKAEEIATSVAYSTFLF